MPNWCLSNYVIEGNKDEIADLFQKLKSLDECIAPLVKSEFGVKFLGNVVQLFGGDWEKIPCRGSFYALEKASKKRITFGVEAAWNEMAEVWDFVCKQYKSLRYYFLAEEPGNCYYVTNDSTGKHFPDRYIIDQCAIGTEYCTSDEALFKLIAERTGKALCNMEEMQKVVADYNAANDEDYTIYVNKIEIV